MTSPADGTPDSPSTSTGSDGPADAKKLIGKWEQTADKEKKRLLIVAEFTADGKVHATIADMKQVSERIKTWDDYLQAGVQLRKATNGKVYMIDSISTLYTHMMAQSPKQYFDKVTGQYIGDQPYMKQIWDETVKAVQMQVTAKVPNANWNQDISNGLVASFVGAVWRKADLAYLEMGEMNEGITEAVLMLQVNQSIV